MVIEDFSINLINSIFIIFRKMIKIFGPKAGKRDEEEKKEEGQGGNRRQSAAVKL